MEHHSNTPAISIRGVSRELGGRTILDGIDLEVERGEFFALVGPSGSGKSTLLKMVSGIDQPTAGEVWLAGENVTGVPPYRRPVHTVFQNYALFPHLNVAGNVGFPLKVAGITRADREKRIAKALALVKLESFAGRTITNLSGGERQRVAVARALVDEPRCILFDEPLSALDPHLRVATLEMIQEIQDRLKITYLYVTHDRQEALRAADRVAVLRGGKLEQVGSPTELYRHPKSAFVASFLGPINWIPGERKEVTLGIRPEDVRIDTSGIVEARVLGCDYCGATSEVRLELAGGTQIVAELRGPPPDLMRGAPVRISWNEDAAHEFATGADCAPSVGAPSHA